MQAQCSRLHLKVVQGASVAAVQLLCRNDSGLYVAQGTDRGGHGFVHQKALP